MVDLAPGKPAFADLAVRPDRAACALAAPALMIGLLAPPAAALERGMSGRPGTGDTSYVADGDTVLFRHADHADVACTDCHSTEEAHGALTVGSVDSCRSCHHAGSTAEPCTACHDRSELAGYGAYRLSRDLEMSVGTIRGRPLPFDHAEHDTVACASCHAGDGTELSAASLRCAGCHDAHHRPDARCTACHLEAPEGSHPLSVHATCTGSGCHDAAVSPVSAATMERSARHVCLGCHRELDDHRPGEACAGCHRVSGGGGGGP